MHDKQYDIVQEHITNLTVEKSPMEKPKTLNQLKESLEKRNSHFDFQFTDEEYAYFMKNARLTLKEKEVLELRRKEESIVAIAQTIGTCESNVNKIIRKIKIKIVKCIVLG